VRRPRRRQLIGLLGGLWFLDGCLQLQPHMLTEAFFVSMFETANVSLPSWLTGVEIHLDTLTGAHPAAWDAAFAGLQLAIGLALLAGRWVRPALAVSVAWSVSVWVFGEGLGGLSLSGANPLTGAPGAALLYALAALMLWPAGTDAGDSVADSGLLRGSGSRLVWAGLWSSTAALWLEFQSHMAQGPGGQLGGVGNGEPGWVAGINHRVGSAVGDNGPALAALLGALQIVAGLGVLHRRTRRVALVVGVVLAMAYGLLGQDLGGVLTGQANDPGTGPVLLLMALALWPGRGAPSTSVEAKPPVGSAHDAGVPERVAAGLGPGGQTVG
jgi:hypothetical protein